MKNRLLVLILVLGFSLRLIGLSSRPLGFTWDEAALGYNAYSLLLTGKDEHAQSFPLIFKSFGDFKPGLYIYFTVLPVKLFGLNEFSTRLPSVFFGSLSILMLFILTRKLFSQKIAISTSFLLAVNPLMIHFSRGAWESNLNLFLLLLIFNLFISSKYWLVALFSGLDLYAYQGAKLNVGFLLVILFIIFRPKIKQLFLPIILIISLSLPVMFGLSSQAGRLKVFSVFSYHRSADYVQNLISQDPKVWQQITSWLYHSEQYDQLRGVAQRFFNHLSPRYLFIEGDWSDHRQGTVYYGNFHLFEVLTILLGFLYLAKKSPKWLFIELIFIVGFILPSALSRDIVTSVRALPLTILLTTLSGIGLTKLISNKKTLPFIFPVLILSVIYFIDLYFRHTPYFFSQDWLSPYKPAISVISEHQKEYNQIYFTDKLGQPYIFFLFYQKFPPALYQLQNTYITGINGDVGSISGFAKYKFGPIFWPQLRTEKNVMVIGDDLELPEKDLSIPSLVNYGDIKYPNGQIGLRIVGLPNNYAQK